VFFVRRPDEPLADFLAVLAGPPLGLSAEQMAATLEGADSLDMVELVMEVEEALRSQLNPLAERAAPVDRPCE
jgi:acyl carrier protein